MTFDLTPEQQAIADRARVVARSAWDAGKTIDKVGRVPVVLTHELLSQALADPFAAGEVAAVLIIEELASASAGLAASIGFGSAAGSGAGGTVIPPALPGLKGCEFELAAVMRSSGSTMQRSRLVCCSVSLGVGRAAVTHAVGAMKRLGVWPGGDETVPHWALADAAADLEAARLLTLRAAQMVERDERDDEADHAIQLARTLSGAAAEKAVQAAIRVSGPDGYVRSSLLERLTRDARTLTVILPYQNDKTTATLP